MRAHFCLTTIEALSGQKNFFSSEKVQISFKACLRLQTNQDTDHIPWLTETLHQ